MKFIPKGVTKAVARTILKTKKNSPHIFFGAGVVGAVGSTVLACKATLSLEKELDAIKDELDEVQEVAAKATAHPSIDYTEKSQRRDKTIVLIKGTARLGKLYGPAIGVGVVSIACLTGSHVQMTRRNAALTATLGTVMKAYDDYRQRIKAELGEERELEIHRGITKEWHEIDGKSREFDVTTIGDWSPYARVFDEGNKNWVPGVAQNMAFLQGQNNWVNHKLHSVGHVFLNDVYRELGYEDTPAGAILGWLSDGEGDRFIDFGLYEAHVGAFVAGMEPQLILDFNVDGPIWDKI